MWKKVGTLKGLLFVFTLEMMAEGPGAGRTRSPTSELDSVTCYVVAMKWCDCFITIVKYLPASFKLLNVEGICSMTGLPSRMTVSRSSMGRTS